MRVTLQDIAEKTAADRGTVSRVLSGRARAFQISHEREQRILDAAAELGYRRNAAAYSLASGRFRQIGVLSPGGETLFNPYQAGILRGIWLAATAGGCRVVVDAARPGEPISYMSECFVDGFVALTPERDVFTAEVRDRLKSTKVPVVVVGGGTWMSEFHGVDIDNVAIGRQAAACLIGHGHRKVAILGGHDEHQMPRCRRKGFLDEMKRHGASVGDVSVIPNDYAQEDAYPDARRLLEERRVSAIFCINDSIALAVFRAAKEVGIGIPAELSVIGVDAIKTGLHTTPPLTSFRQPLVDMGREAFTLLMKNSKRVVRRIFEPEFVEGGSVGPCRRCSFAARPVRVHGRRPAT